MEYVIIVDDEISNTKNMSESIEFEDRKVLTFNDPVDFMNFIENNDLNKCKLLIVDFSMPKLNGYEVYEKLFEKNVFSSYNVLYTGNINQINNSQTKYLKEKNIEFVEKPNIERILELVISKVSSI